MNATGAPSACEGAPIATGSSTQAGPLGPLGTVGSIGGIEPSPSGGGGSVGPSLTRQTAAVVVKPKSEGLSRLSRPSGANRGLRRRPLDDERNGFSDRATLETEARNGLLKRPMTDSSP